MDAMQVLESVFRWVHVVAGILWIGLLYFFNWVNSAFAPTLDADSKKKVVPELLPRALFWFRWGAAYTWVSGVLLLLLVYYHGPNFFDADGGWGAMAGVIIAITFLAVFAYDAMCKALPNNQAVFVVGWLAASGLYVWWDSVAGISFRGATIHLGALFGTNMAFNVWYRIWPAQQKIITAIKNGEAPDGSLVALAGGRSKHNTYMSIPLVFLMLNQHMTWTASEVWAIPAVILVGWLVCFMLYKKAAAVKGF